MTFEQTSRLNMLGSGPGISGDYLHGYYGLDESIQNDPLYVAFVATLPRRDSCPSGWISRYELERFMARNRILPRKWMGARLGMTLASLEAVLHQLPVLGMQPARYIVGPFFVADALHDDLISHLAELRFRTFGGHNSFCDHLHRELRQIQEIEIDELWCETSTRLEEAPRWYAAYFDCLTLEAISTKHATWLDFHKPLSLPPDRCSKLFYFENRDTLRPFNAGLTEPDFDADYERFLGTAQHG